MSTQNTNYETSDHSDLTPNKLASFYRDLNGNYDQLFLGTPPASVAFIYKSLGCLHSLQPLPKSTAFNEPIVPALKKEGWIMWQTIQLLLGPEEHSSFLIRAVEKWDVKDPSTGDVFPKLLPRQCFPLEPDKHMVAWYEGVSERLRQEAEEEERQRAMEAQEAEMKRIEQRRPPSSDSEGTVDSKGPALAYFRDPLYRQGDGRPSIVRNSSAARSNSKRPPLSPRHSVMEKGKDAAKTIGGFVRNVASPNLWDGYHRGSSSSGTRKDSDRDKRRRSVPHDHHFPGDPPVDAFETEDPSSLHPRHHSSHDHHRRHASHDRPTSARTDADDEWDTSETSPGRSPMPHHHHNNPSDRRLRQSKSHDPNPSPSYFPPYSPDERRRRSDANSPAPETPENSIGPSFMPTQSPLFASSYAAQQQAPVVYQDARSSRRRPHMRSPERYARPGSNPNERGDRERSERREALARPPDDGYGPGPATGSDVSAGSRPTSAGYDSRDAEGRRESSMRSERGQRPKAARFVTPVGGVSGRRYPNETPWR